MIRRFFSHIIIGLATFVLSTTLFMWALNNRVFDPDTLNAELRKAGVTQEFAELIPKIATPDENASDMQEEVYTQAINEIATYEYVDAKVSELNTAVITYIKDGQPEPTLDISDIPDRLQAKGVLLDDESLDTFNEPVNLNEGGGLDKVHDIYTVFSRLSVLGIVLFILLMGLEWLVAEKGKKLRRLSRVFLYAGLSYALYWGMIVALPIWGTDIVNNAVRAKYDTSALVESVLKSIEGLFSFYFMVFALSCLSISLILYLVRHFKHGDVLKSHE